MFGLRVSFLCAVCALAVTIMALPDSGGNVPLPGPGLAYGGIPYGSVSGNVAEFFKRQAPSSGRLLTYAGNSNTDYAPIEQYLR